MSFVERQVDLGGKSRLIKELKDLRVLLEERSRELEGIKKRVEKLEGKVGLREESERDGEREDISDIRDMVLLENEDDDLYNLMFVYEDDRGEILKISRDDLVDLCRRIVELGEGDEITVSKYEQRGIWCERDEDGDWVMME